LDRVSLEDDRHLEFEGLFNARDLGGLPASGGRVTRRGALVRSDTPERMTAQGWRDLVSFGISTIVDLRNDDEVAGDAAERPVEIETVRVPIDDIDDREYWEHCWSNELDGSPLYYSSFLDRKPDRCAEAMSALAHARPGGVLFHCVGGRDRTGLVSLLSLALVGVPAEVIASDYELSAERLRHLYASFGMADQGIEIAEILQRKGKTARGLILDLLESLDVLAHLRGAGLTEKDLTALRTRLIG
jgi:protein tyrosine/serine phosphatase